MTLSIVVVVIALVLVAGAVPARDLASPAGPAPAPAATRPGPVARYEAVRKRGAPIAVLRRRVALRATPRRNGRVLARAGRRTEWRSPRVLAVTRRRGRWLRVIATELPNGRRAWIPLGAARIGPNPWRITVDLSSRALALYRRGRLVRRFRVAVGGPSTPTPRGRFAVTDKIAMDDGSAAYGCCAVALSGHQTRIASGWTGGDRLAIHATHLVGTIGTAASYGCLRARDADARFLMRRVWLGTVVTITG